MTAPTTSLLREWKRLSAEESTAITLRDWDHLNQLLDEIVMPKAKRFDSLWIYIPFFSKIFM